MIKQGQEADASLEELDMNKCEGSAIYIINEPLDGSAVFLVETEEGRTLPETPILCFV